MLGIVANDGYLDKGRSRALKVANALNGAAGQMLDEAAAKSGAAAASQQAATDSLVGVPYFTDGVNRAMWGAAGAIQPYSVDDKNPDVQRMMAMEP